MAKRFILTGPTGSGKSKHAIALAQRLDAEIISMDSMALYRHMDIGTAKPDAEERTCVPHHLIDVLDPWESASVAWWLEQAKLCCDDIESRGRQVLFVGGTPLYLKALLFGLFEGPPADNELRQRLEAEAELTGANALHRRLASIDADSARRIHPNDVRRVVRALEVWESTGKPMSQWQQQWPTRTTEENAEEPSSGIAIEEGACVWLDLPREELYRRINTRVETMIQAGWIDEVRALNQLEQPWSREAAQALGYKEFTAYLRGATSLEEATRIVQQRSRNFAKRQVTWFRHLTNCSPILPKDLISLWE